MTKEEIYHDFCKKVQSGEYKISQVTRSNSPVLGKQEFNFTLEKLHTAEDVCVLNVEYCPMCGRPLNEEEE